MKIDPFRAALDIADVLTRKKPLKDFDNFLNFIQSKFSGLKNPALFAQKVFLDNSLRELISGKLRISEKTLNELAQQALSDMCGLYCRREKRNFTGLFYQNRLF